MNKPTIPIDIQKNIEQRKSWEGISTPNELAQYLSTVMSIDPNKLLQLQDVVYSDTEPNGAESKKLWIKTTAPIGIGIPSGGAYEMIYQYPKKVPFIYVGDPPFYLRKLTDAELEDYSLKDTMSNKAKWVILNV